MLGMYVHTHWGYNRPYAARRWTIADWAGFLDGLSRLGFDTLKVWPLIDAMPPAPTGSDLAYLDTLAAMIRLAHERFRMRVYITLTGNCMGNELAAGYDCAARPYFVCEHKVNPRRRPDVQRFIAARRRALAFLREADGIVVIDSDPGGYIGSTNEEFVELCLRQAKVFRALNPRGEFVYWMLAGWECYNRFWQAQREDARPNPDMWSFLRDDFLVTLSLLKARMPEPWWLLASIPQHEQALDASGLWAKALYYPYGVIEGEPTFPLALGQGVDRKLDLNRARRYPRGLMGNAQTHCLQLYHLYQFAHLARGDAPAKADPTAFADRLLPGLGGLIHAGWQALEPREPARQRALARRLRDVAGSTLRAGDLAGLLFGDGNRFLIDLAMNLELRAALAEFQTAVDSGQGVKDALRSALATWAAYQRRVGFVDAYSGVLMETWNKPLGKIGDPGIDKVLADFHNWRHPAVRNGIVPRLIAALEQYVR